MSWDTQEDFLRDLDNYAEYTRPKIDANGHVICDAPIPDTLVRFFGGNAMSSKERLKAKEVDSDKDVDESSFEKRDELKDLARECFQKKVNCRVVEDDDSEGFLKTKSCVPRRMPWHEPNGPSNQQAMPRPANMRQQQQQQWGPKSSSHRNPRGPGSQGGGGGNNKVKTIFIPSGMSYPNPNSFRR